MQHLTVKVPYSKRFVNHVTPAYSFCKSLCFSPFVSIFFHLDRLTQCAWNNTILSVPLNLFLNICMSAAFLSSIIYFIYSARTKHFDSTIPLAPFRIHFNSLIPGSAPTHTLWQNLHTPPAGLNDATWKQPLYLFQWNLSSRCNK